MAKKIIKKRGSKTLLFIGIAVLLIVLALFFVLKSGTNYNRADVDAFAKCITEKGAVMYGTFWCPHCANVKKMFGESFSYVKYVECDPRGDDEQSLLCIEKGIENYATFEFNNDSNSWLVGEPSFEELSEKTGCPVPEIE